MEKNFWPLNRRAGRAALNGRTWSEFGRGPAAPRSPGRTGRTVPPRNINLSKMKSALVVVLVHGMDGSEYDWRVFANELDTVFERMTKHLDTRLFVLSSNVNASAMTRDGIATVGDRLLHEVMQWMHETVLPALSPRKSASEATAVSDDLADFVDSEVQLHFSIAGHSAGGLFARYALKSLMVGENDEPSKLEALLKPHANITLVPTTFLTASSPHLGARRPAGVDFITKFMSSSASFAKNMFGSSGKDLFMVDEETLAAESSAPTTSQDMKLLSRMAQGDYIKALKMFPNRCLVGVVRHDIVQFTSATIRTQNPFAQPLSFRTADSKCRLLAYSGFHSEGITEDEIQADKIHAFYQRNLFTDNSTIGPWTIEELCPTGTRHDSGEAFPPSALLDTLSRPDKLVATALQADKAGESDDGRLTPSPMDVTDVSEEEIVFPKLDRPPTPTFSHSHSKTLSTSSVSKKTSGVTLRRLFKRDPSPMERSASVDCIESASVASLSRNDSTRSNNSTRSTKSTKSSKTHRKSKSNGSEMVDPVTDWCVDAPHSLEFSKAMISQLQSIHFRRMAIRLDLSQPIWWAVTHPLVIGKPLKLVPEFVLEVGRASAECLARVIVVDFLACFPELEPEEACSSSPESE